MRRVVLVTGASSGIGAAAARAFAEAGDKVGLVARRAEVLEALVEEIGADNAVALPADISDPQQVTLVLDRLVDRFGDVDVAVNSAGVCPPMSLSETTPEAWRQVLDVNLDGTFFVAREAGMRMLEGGGGVIVNVASELARIGAPGFSAYCASKAAVTGLTRALAAELAPKVRVNAVSPGPVDTPMLAAEFEGTGDAGAARRESDARVPLGRSATVEEVAEAILFLADASYATGSELALDGGTTVT